MVNPDGVAMGNARCSLSGQDLSTKWQQPDRLLHPEIYYTKKTMKMLQENNEIIFFGEIGGGHNFKGNWTNCLEKKNLTDKRQQRRFPALLNEFCNEFQFSNCKYKILEEGKKKAAFVLGTEFNLKRSYEFKCSGLGFRTQGSLEIDHLKLIGETFLDVLAGYFLMEFKVKKIFKKKEFSVIEDYKELIHLYKMPAVLQEIQKNTEASLNKKKSTKSLKALSNVSTKSDCSNWSNDRPQMGPGNFF